MRHKKEPKDFFKPLPESDPWLRSLKPGDQARLVEIFWAKDKVVGQREGGIYLGGEYLMKDGIVEVSDRGDFWRLTKEDLTTSLMPKSGRLESEYSQACSWLIPPNVVPVFTCPKADGEPLVLEQELAYRKLEDERLSHQLERIADQVFGHLVKNDDWPAWTPTGEDDDWFDGKLRDFVITVSDVFTEGGDGFDSEQCESIADWIYDAIALLSDFRQKVIQLGDQCKQKEQEEE